MSEGAVWVDCEGVGVGCDGEYFGGGFSESVDDVGGCVVLFVHVSILCGDSECVNGALCELFGRVLSRGPRSWFFVDQVIAVTTMRTAPSAIKKSPVYSRVVSLREWLVLFGVSVMPFVCSVVAIDWSMIPMRKIATAVIKNTGFIVSLSFHDVSACILYAW